MQPIYIILIILGIIGVIWLIVRAAQAAAERERRRVAELTDWSARNGFAFHKDDPHDLDRRFNGVFEIGRGHDRYALEVLSRSDPVPAFIFQYHFKTWETRTVTYTDSKGRTHTRTETYEETHWRRYLIVQLPAPFPSLSIRPEGWFDKVAGFIGFDDIDFESEEFSSKYHIKSADRQFAYAVIHPQMMEWMLSASPQSLQLESNLVLMTPGGSHDAPSCHAAWSAVVGFINRVPPFVWQDYGKTSRIELPTPSAPTPSPREGRGQG